MLRDLRFLGCEVLVAARHRVSQERAVAGGASQVVASLEELTAVPGLSGFVVVTEIADHTRAIRALAPCGLPIFVEKPLCSNGVEAQQIAAEHADLVFVMDKWRYHPGVLVLQQLVRKGAIGSVVGIRTRRNQWGDRHQGVEALWTLMPHDLAIVDELLGGVPPLTSVCPDIVSGNVEGVIASFGCEPWVVIECLARAPRIEREILVFGTDGVAVLPDGYAAAIHVFRPQGNGTPEVHPARGELPLLSELREFVGFLEGGSPPRAGAVRAARHVQIIEDVLRAAYR